MSEENKLFEEPKTELCEACGVSAEMGFIIKEDDDVAEVSLFGDSKAALEAEFKNYEALAKQVNANAEIEVAPLSEDAKELHARIKFEVSAEKLIFELKTRSLAR
ncbi:YfcZ/YiiS family protein [Vibrio hannami]|uniref:YfcZ/YiiS family protein n=1 Tax=Vibrio hannami TaxID=2717094 RepID=UPI00240F9659|nr:YfcZ/YiiS family protein [Vibrio hannami]MDG3085599.1 YfcZ/YiiS family protein [Vibrio hannami]